MHNAIAIVDKDIVSIDDAMKDIRGCKAIFIITDLNDNVDIKGYIFYITACVG